MPGYLTRNKAKGAADNANKRAEQQGRPGRITERDVITMFEFFGWRCIYCGGDGLDTSDRVIGLDHVVAMCNGGTNELRNIVCCCKPCNASKSRYDVYRWMVKKNMNTQRFQDLFRLWQQYLDAYRPE
jgi:hypothetical protein